jgi:K+-transporting ATPase ATPase C chain
VKDPEEPCLDDAGRRIPPIVVERVKAYRELNGLGPNTLVPVDAVTASASGLDPHISIANARIQARRVAEERGVPVRQVLDLVDDNTDGRFLEFIGEKGVNVLELNLALDQLT